MLSHRAEHEAVARLVELDASVGAVEAGLRALHEALRERDAPAVSQQADELLQALETAVRQMRTAARHGGVPTELRLRLARAGAQVAQQREMLARATAALDRAIDLLLPDDTPLTRLYDAQGLARPSPRGGGGFRA
ncbi:MAG: hypothetical protein RL223_181 [Pseudomonadota bacterium]